MRCDEVQPLHGLYLDSELDARTALEVEHHLKSCAECAHLFAEEEGLNARLRAGLNRGQTTAALWEQIECAVLAAAPATNRLQPALGARRPAGWPGLLLVLGEHLQAGWRRSRWAWSGLAAAWGVILTLNLATREDEPRLAAANRLPPASQVRLAVEQKQLLMAELAFAAGSTPADKPKASPPGPRSDRRSDTLNA
jgi:anti-sigma factor RsiW